MRVQQVVTKLTALALGGIFFYCIIRFPFRNTPLAPILLVCAGLLAWRPRWCLFLLPALLPVLDLAPWTGWFFIEEIDLLLLLTTAIAYWRLDASTLGARLPPFAMTCMAIITFAYLIGVWRGLMPLQAIDVNSFTDYLSTYNSLRIGKSWFWAMLLLPIMLHHAGHDLSQIERYFIPGMLTGLALVTCAAIRERWLFPGITNFSRDYRITAPFSGMHTGGAALDGYLAMTLPLLVIWLLARQSCFKVSAGSILLALAGYAGLSTFSRGLYAAYACSALIIIVFLIAPSVKKHASAGLVSIVAVVGIVALILYVLMQVFSSAGYRGLAACLILLLAAASLATIPIPPALWQTTALLAVLLEAISGSILTFLGGGSGMFKPPYLLFAIATMSFAVATIARIRSTAGAMVAFWCMAMNALWVGIYWGGPDALWPVALTIAIALALMIVNAMLDVPLWHPSRGNLMLAVASAILLALVIPFSASYYAIERFGTSSEDLHGRINHWKQVLSIMDRDNSTSMLGMGLGKFPLIYRWRNHRRELPGLFRYRDEVKEHAHNRYVQLDTPQYPSGYGDMLRLLQQVALRPDMQYLLDIDIRRPDEHSALHIALCERVLLYPQSCVEIPLGTLTSGPYWQHHTLRLNSVGLGGGVWLQRLPVQIEIAVMGKNTSIDIDNISLREEISGANMIRNGSFSDANDYWFFSSDRYHLPWHAKNLFLNLYFELGWFGVLSFGVLLLYTMAHLMAQTGHVGHHAAAYFAALTGFHAVGLFDSLLDVPRLALLFFMMLLVALMLPSRPAPRSP